MKKLLALLLLLSSPAWGQGTTASGVQQSGSVTANHYPVWVAKNLIGDSGVPIGSQVYPGAGIANSTGSSWGTSYGVSGTGSVCLTSNCSLITPNLGTPSAVTLTNGTGLPYSGLTGVVPTWNQNTTGNAATATALASLPSLCSGGQFALGIIANGNASCSTPPSTAPGGSTYSIQYNAGSSNFGGIAVGTSQILIGQSGTNPAAETINGDLTLTSLGTATLATVNPNVGTFQGLAINGKGLVTSASNQNYLTGNQTITWAGSGDVSGSASGATSISPSLTLATVNSNVGSYGSATVAPILTVNGKGLLTAVGTAKIAPAWSSITGTPTTLVGYGITNPLDIAEGGTNATMIGTAMSNLLGNPTSGNYFINCTSSTNCTTISAASGGVTTFSAGTTGFTPNSATAGAVTLAGILNISNGGTGAATTTAYSIFGNNTGSPAAPAFVTAPIISGALETLQTIGTTSTDGLMLYNTTAATASIQQFSPRLHFEGQGWKTNATAASQSMDFIQEVEPISGAAHPGGGLQWSAAIGTSVYTPAMNLSSTGNLQLSTTMFLNGASSALWIAGAASSSGIYFTTNTLASASSTLDTSISRSSAGVIQIGTSTQNAAGTLQAAAIEIGTATISASNVLEANGAASIGYVDVGAPSNGLIVKGNVGIGTTSPLAQLDVFGSNGIADFTVRSSSGAVAFYDFSNGINFIESSNASVTASQLLEFTGYGSSIGTFDFNGSVGIGTTAPLNSLDIYLGGVAIGNGYAGVATAPTNGLIVQGLVGIGTSFVPVVGNDLLDVYTSTTSKNAIIRAASTTRNASIILDANSSFSGAVVFDNGGSEQGRIDYNNTSNALLFDTNEGGTPNTNERMRITSSGAVGIGTTSPANQLDVNGSAAFGTYVGTAAPSNGLIVSGNVGIGTTSPVAKLSFGQATGVNTINLYESGTTGSFGWGIQANELQSYIPAGAHFSFNSGGSLQTSGTNEAMRITAGGAVLMPLLTTSSAVQTGTVCWATSNGNLTVDTTTTCLLSSLRFKKDIHPMDGALSDIMKMRPITFVYKDKAMGTDRLSGLIAEEVLPIDKTLVELDDEGRAYKIRYEGLAVKDASAIQELQHEIENLREQIHAMPRKCNIFCQWRETLEDL